MSAGAGLGLVCFAWRRRPVYRLPLLLSGWFLIAASIAAWVEGTGAEFGLVFAAACVAFMAWGAVLLNIESRPRRAGSALRKSPGFPTAAGFRRNTALFVQVFFLAAVVSLALALGVSRLLPASEIERMAFVIVALPVVWGLLAYYASYSRLRARSTAILAGLGVVGAMLMVL